VRELLNGDPVGLYSSCRTCEIGMTRRWAGPTSRSSISCTRRSRVLEQFLDWLARLPAFPTYLVLMALSALENVFPRCRRRGGGPRRVPGSPRGGVSGASRPACWLANTASSVGMYHFARTTPPSPRRRGASSCPPR